MIRRAALLAFLVGAGCHTTPPPAAPTTGGTGGPGSAAAPGTAAPKGDLEERVQRIEVYLAKNAEAIDFLNKVLEQQKRQAAEEEAREPAPDAVFAVAIAENVKAGLVEGPPTALVTVVKAFDFACPHCQRMSPILHDLVQEYGGKLRVVYMDRVVHDVAEKAHLAACAAAKQGKYVAFKTAFWDKSFGAYAASAGRDRSGFELDGLVALAKDVGLDLARFKTDLASPACTTLLEHERVELDKFKVDGTPTFFVNGTYVSGGLPKDAMRSLIDARLKVAEASGVPAAQYYDREILGKGEKKFRSKKDPKP